MTDRHPELNLSGSPPQTRPGEVFDPVRRQWVVNTPEEWVRQHAITFLTEKLGVPMALLSVEKAHRMHAGQRRADITAYDRIGQPWMIIECKAASMELGQSALDQVIRYASDLGSRYIAVTNGLRFFAALREEDGFHFLNALPRYPHNQDHGL